MGSGSYWLVYCKIMAFGDAKHSGPAVIPLVFQFSCNLYNYQATHLQF